MEILTIILTILKWIGILLLSIVGLIVLLLLLVLLWPISYQMDASYDGKIMLNAKVSWFLGIIKVQFSYSDSPNFGIKVFGSKIFPKNQKTVKQKVAETVTLDRSEKMTDTQSKPSPENIQKESIQEEAQKEEESEIKRISLDERVHSFCDKLYSVYEQWKTRIVDIFEKIRDIKENAEYYLKLLQREEVKSLLTRVLKMLGKMLMHIRPRKLSVIAHVGMDDPSVTGQIMAVQGLLYPWLAQKVIIYPYFEEKKLEGRFLISGHTILGVLLICVLRIVINKDFLKVLRLLRKKEDKNNGRA